MLTPATRQQYHTLLDALTLNAASANQPAIIFVQTGKAPRVVSRADFCQAVAGCAAALQQLAIAQGDLVAIADTQRPESVFAFWAALMLGALPSMLAPLTEKLDPQIYMDHLARLTRISGVKLILTASDLASQLTEVVSCPVRDLTSLFEPVQPEIRAMFEPDENAVAFLQHSSGTTGLQKGIALTHRAVLNQIASYSDAVGLGADDVIVSWLPLYHDMGLIAGFLLPLFQGVSLVLMSPFDWVANPALLFQAISEYRGTLCWLPNFAYNHCARRIRDVDLEDVSLKSMRAFINCSEPVRRDSHLLFLEHFGTLGVSQDHLAVSYAMAENVFAVTQTVPGQPARVDWVDAAALAAEKVAQPLDAGHPRAIPQVSCGPTIANVHVRVIDPEGRPCPDRAVGELAISSDCLLTGYYHRDDLQAFDAAGWYRTGDRGYIAEGEVYVVGRSKDLIINAGKNIYPQDIEAVVNTVPGIYPGRAVAFGVFDEREGTELIAIVAEIDDEMGIDVRQIKRLIRQRISQQTMVTVNYVDLVGARWLIKTSSGKIARAANREKWLAERAR